jgi:hypothetical protein
MFNRHDCEINNNAFLNDLKVVVNGLRNEVEMFN